MRSLSCSTSPKSHQKKKGKKKKTQQACKKLQYNQEKKGQILLQFQHISDKMPTCTANIVIVNEW